jgi:hypothetical protein
MHWRLASCMLTRVDLSQEAARSDQIDGCWLTIPAKKDIHPE